MSEASIVAGLMISIKAMSEFADADVVDSDWSLLDQSTVNAPYVIFTPSDDFDSTQDAMSPEAAWEIPAVLVEPFTDWKTSLPNLRTRRQAIIDKIDTIGSSNRSPSSDSNSSVDRIHPGSPIEPYYDPWLSEEEAQEATPIFLYQILLFDTREW